MPQKSENRVVHVLRLIRARKGQLGQRLLKAAGGDSDDLRRVWYTIRDSFRTFCREPTEEMRAVFEGLRELRRVG